MATTKDTVLARILIDDQTKVGFQSYARNAERAKKTTEAFRAQAVDKLVSSLDQQFLALGQSARQLDITKAKTLGATAAEQGYINKLHGDIEAHHQAVALEAQLSKEREQATAATDRVAAAVHRSEQAYLQERATVGMTADELEIYRLKMMGANQAQLESVMSTQEATKAFRKQGSAAAGTAKGGLRLMRGGMGQLGHQVQDVAVQLQMGQDAMLIFGQQGSQIASLFGKNGALIGAVLAVGAALGTSLAPSLFNSKSAMEKLGKATEDLSKLMSFDGSTGIAKMSEELTNLARISEDLAKNTFQATLALAMLKVEETTSSATAEMKKFLVADDLAKFTGGVESLSNKFGIAYEDAEALSNAFDDIRSGADASGDGFRDLLVSIDNVTQASNGSKKAFLSTKSVILADLAARKLANEKIKEAERILGDFDAELLKGNKTYQEATSEKKSFIDQLVTEALGLGKVESALIRQQAEALNLSDAEMKVVEALILHKEGIEDLEKVRAAAKKTKDEEAAQAKKAADAIKNYVINLRESTEEIGLNAEALIRLQGKRLGSDPVVIENLIAERAARLAVVDAITRQGQAEINIESLRQSLLTEEEALLESFAEQNRIIAEGFALGTETEQSARDLQLQILAKYLEDKKALLDQGVTDELEGMNFLEKATIEGAKRLESFNKLSATEQTQHVLGELSGQFNGIAKNNKRLFAISKAFNIANAIMNTATAATVAYKSYPPPLNYVMAGGVIAAGMGQVAQIKSQSFEGGGFTGNGARSGGLDGKGGFPAMLHPNESVIDHTKGQAGGITIINNVDASGSGADVDMKIRSAMQQTSQQTILSIQDLMRRKRFG